MKRNILITVFLITGVLLFNYIESISNLDGRTGRTLPTSQGCYGGSCHGTAAPDPGTTLILTSGTGVFTVLPGSTTNFSITVRNINGINSGIDISVRDQSGTIVGTLNTVDNDLKVSNSELTHRAPKLMEGGAAVYNFTWQAPTTEGTYTLYAAGLAGNNNGQADINDLWNRMSMDIIVDLGPPTISVPDTIDFGDVRLGRQKDTVINIKNTGNKILRVTGIELLGDANGEFSFPQGAPLFELEPMQTKPLTVRFTPSSVSDNKTAYINFTNNSPVNPKRVNLKATCLSAIKAFIATSDTNINFGSVKITDYIEKTITIKNVGEKNLQVTGSNISGVNRANYSLTNPGNFSLEPDSSYKLTIRFTPTATGLRTAEINFTGNASNDVVLKLTGTGLPGPKPTLTVSLNNINFGSIPLTKSKDTVVVLKNIGDSLLEVTNVIKEGSSPDDFQVVSGGGSFYLAKNQTRNMTLRFEPKLKGIGKTARIRFESNDTASPVIQLTGSATDAPKPVIDVNYVSIEFGDVKITKERDSSFKIYNWGNADLVISSIKIIPAGNTEFKLSSDYKDVVVPPMDSLIIPIVFIPSSVGQKTATIEITSNAGNPLQISLTGRGIQEKGVAENIAGENIIRIYPNPSGIETGFYFDCDSPVNAGIKIVNSLGFTVKELKFDENHKKWDATDQSGYICPEGVYYAIIKENAEIRVFKMVLLR